MPVSVNASPTPNTAPPDVPIPHRFDPPGRPIAQATWEAQYQSGFWDYLHSTREMAHYFVIGGYVCHAHSSPRILEVGCGDGLLLALLSVLGFDSYLGIDISSEALRRARALGIDEARLEIADMDEWESAEQFDVIILNESLYYSRRPVQLLQKIARWLVPGGALIVSMHCNAESPGIWRAIDVPFQDVDGTVVHNRRDAWEIRLLRLLPTVTPK